MANVLPFRLRDECTKEEIKEYLCEAVDRGELIVLIAEVQEDNSFTVRTNYKFGENITQIIGLIKQGEIGITGHQLGLIDVGL
jgi:hypothetical protein